MTTSRPTIGTTHRPALAPTADRTELALGGSAVLTGLLAGLYYAFAVAVMPGLARGGDHSFVRAMNHINVAILNPGFLATFAGAPITAIAATYLSRRRGQRRRTRLALAAVACHVVGFAITTTINVPLNDALARTGNRDAFELTWNAANGVRALVTTAALVFLLAALATARDDAA